MYEYIILILINVMKCLSFTCICRCSQLLKDVLSRQAPLIWAYIENTCLDKPSGVIKLDSCILPFLAKICTLSIFLTQEAQLPTSTRTLKEGMHAHAHMHYDHEQISISITYIYIRLRALITHAIAMFKLNVFINYISRLHACAYAYICVH